MSPRLVQSRVCESGTTRVSTGGADGLSSQRIVTKPRVFPPASSQFAAPGSRRATTRRTFPSSRTTAPAFVID